MFARRLQVLYTAEAADDTAARKCPVHWIDSFAMRNFTNDAIFDDTLPAADGLLEVGYRVPHDALLLAMTDWFLRKGYLRAGERLVLREDGQRRKR